MTPTPLFFRRANGNLFDPKTIVEWGGTPERDGDKWTVYVQFPHDWEHFAFSTQDGAAKFIDQIISAKLAPGGGEVVITTIDDF